MGCWGLGLRADPLSQEQAAAFQEPRSAGGR